MTNKEQKSDWMYDIFDKDRIMAYKEQWTKEAEEAGMTLTEYLESIKPTPCRSDGKSMTHLLETLALDRIIKEQDTGCCQPSPRVADYIGKNAIHDLIKQLQDILLIFGSLNGNKIILTITDGESEYRIKDITGKMCAQYFEPSDNVSEAIIRISRK